ncbi:hypothetical protein D9M72_200510 [compost metagenome]
MAEQKGGRTMCPAAAQARASPPAQTRAAIQSAYLMQARLMARPPQSVAWLLLTCLGPEQLIWLRFMGCPPFPGS